MYKLTNKPTIIRVEDGACIPTDTANSDYLNYLDWLAEGNTPLPADEPVVDIQLVVTAAVQARLDTFARTRNYDGILSACTYATSTVPKFKAEGQCCVDARDATWATLYQFMAEVQAGSKPMPSSFADVEPLLPTLTWPA